LRAADGEGGTPGPLVLTTKLNPPAIRGAVSRPALIARLSEHPAHRIVLVAAPAGWGKTTLLADWCATVSQPFAWVSLDPGDNDPVRFWVHVIAALNAAAPGVVETVPGLIRTPGMSLTGTVLPALINDLAVLRQPMTLVMDDYHMICSTPVLESIAFLVDHLPLPMRLMIASRADPALPLAKLRASRAIAEIREEDLRFTEAETTELLNTALGLGLSQVDIARLQQRTEGWSAGLQLAGISLQGREDKSDFIKTFAGDDWQIADYLVTEVLEGLPAGLRSFLLRTSILERLSAPLCDAVVEGTGSDRVLAEIERASLFLIPLDTRRRWYRYHQLFAEMLRYELERSSPGEAALLHRRASLWHRADGEVGEAIHHSLQAGDAADARELIASHWNTYFNNGLVSTVDAWLDQLPQEMVEADSRLCLTRAWLARHLGRLDEVEPWVSAAEEASPQGPLRDEVTSIESGACLLRAGYRHMMGDLAAASWAARQAAGLESAGTPRWQAVSLATLGANLCWRGAYPEASAMLQQVVRPYHAPANNLAALWATGCLALMAADDRDIDSAQRWVAVSDDLAARYGLGDYWVAATAVLASALVLEQRAADGQGAAHTKGAARGQAEATARRALELARRGQARLEQATCLLCLARLRFSAGDAGQARALLDQARRCAAGCAEPGILARFLRRTERALQLRPGSPHRCPAQPDCQALTDRERAVLRLLASDLSLREIAGELYVSHNTVKTQARSIYRKLQVSSRDEAVATARGTGPPGS
jgi:ATP/maltotriose-dependent transcriptional regulator MalT